MKKAILLTAWIIIILTAVIDALILLHMLRLPFIQVNVFGATNSLTHWIGWIGTLYIAIATLFLPIVKRKAPIYFGKTLNIHIIGNLIAVFLVSVHFAHQITRSASAYPDLGTGVVLSAAMMFLVATGILRYSDIGKRFVKQLIFLHPAFAVTFYMVIILHILHGLLLI
jgi:hypothetical protein